MAVFVKAIFLLVGLQFLFADGRLWKNQTLRLPVLLPISGPIAPLTEMCLKSLELLVDTVNNQSALLPGYNLVIDIFDNQCIDSVALNRILPFFLEGRSVLEMNETVAQFSLPDNKAGVMNQTAYVPPLLMGGTCSAVCQVVTKFAQHFDMINFSTGCNSDKLSNRKVYRNFYRVQADQQSQYAVVNMIGIMGWNKVGIVSEPSVEMFQKAAYFLSAFSSVNISVLAAEFYSGDPSQALNRIKASGARILTANCYYDSCTSVACRAYQLGLSGPRFVWFFPGSVNLLAMDRPSYCSKEMIAEVDRRTFYYDFFRPDYQNRATSIGITGNDLDGYLARTVANVTRHPFYGSRTMCFDNVMPAVFILDYVERKLAQSGSTLSKVIADPSMKSTLTQLVREGTQSLDVKLFSGHVRYEPGAMDTEVPGGYTQVQNGTRVYVFVDKGADAKSREERYEFPRPFIWQTPDGKAPKAEMTVLLQKRRVPQEAVVLFSVISGATILVSLMAVLGLQMHHWNRVGVLGVSMWLTAIVIYPSSDSALAMKTFCQVAPLLFVFGYCLLNACLLVKLSFNRQIFIIVSKESPMHSLQQAFRSLRTVFSERLQRIAARNVRGLKTRVHNQLMRQGRVAKNRQIWQSMAIFFLTVMTLAFWYSCNGMPTTRHVVFTSYNEVNDLLLEEIWEECSSDTSNPLYSIGYSVTVIALQGFCLLAAFFLAVMKRRSDNPNVRHAVLVVYGVFPTTVASLLTVIISDRPDVVYYLLALMIIVQSLMVIYAFCSLSVKLLLKKFNRKTKPPRVAVVIVLQQN